MLKTLLITCSIILLNTLYFYFGGREIVLSQPFFMRETFHALYKILVYLGPVLLCLYLRGRGDILTLIKGKFSFPKNKRLWIAIFLRGVGLYMLSGMGTPNFGTYSLFHVLITNSLIEEIVFRGYVQEQLIASYGVITGIIFQSIAFGVVHLPLYYTHYLSGAYDGYDMLISSYLPVQTLGPAITLLTLGTPIVLGLIRGVITYKYKSLLPGTIRHSVHNSIVFFG